MNSKEYFLSTIGARVTETLTQYDLSFQRFDESRPFCTIVTDSTGKCFLRVNPWEPHGVTVKLQ